MARLDPVNRPDLLPSEFTPVIDVAGYLAPSEEKRLAAEVTALERDTGFKLRVLAQSYPETPGEGCRQRGGWRGLQVWGVGWACAIIPLARCPDVTESSSNVCCCVHTLPPMRTCPQAWRCVTTGPSTTTPSCLLRTRLLPTWSTSTSVLASTWRCPR